MPAGITEEMVSALARDRTGLVSRQHRRPGH